jgi:hypothetical protein
MSVLFADRCPGVSCDCKFTCSRSLLAFSATGEAPLSEYFLPVKVFYPEGLLVCYESKEDVTRLLRCF